MPFATKLHSKLHSSLAGNMLDDGIFDEKKVMFKLASADIVDVISGNAGTFIRATPATYIDANGDMQTAASGEARFQSDIGYFGEIASTNKCTNYNANPDSGLVAMGGVAAFNAAVTNLTAVDGGAGALFGVVDGATAIAAAGLDAICTAGLLIKVDNTSGSGFAYLTSEGATNTNKHSLSGWLMADSGSAPEMRFDDGEGTISTTATALTKLISENVTPSSGAKWQMRVAAGDVGYFILNQLGESAFSTSEIITEGSAVTRNKDDLSYPTTFIPVNDCVFSFDWTPTAAGQGTIILFGLGVSTDFIAIFHDGTNIRFRKTLSSTNYDGFKALSYVAGTTYSIKGRLSSVGGVHLWIDDVIGENSDSNTDDAIIAATLNIGSHYNLTAHQTGGIKNFTVHKGKFTDAQVIAL